jgi:23S rRNA (guanosine2251-2'-O)-methyltransferase
MAKSDRHGDRRGGPPNWRGGRHGGPDRPRQGHPGQGRDRRDAPNLGPRGDRLWLHGIHPVLAALANPDRPSRRLLVTAEVAERLGDRLEAALASHSGRLKAEIVDRRSLDNLLRGAVHQGIALEADPLPETFLADLLIRAEASPESLLVVLDQVTDPHNVGAILRSCAAFGAEAAITTERHAPGETAALAKAAAGALDLVPLIRVGNLARALADLKGAGYRCIGLDGEADHAIDAIPVPARRALVLGAEGAGMRRLTRDLCDDVVRIPMAAREYAGGALESLNVSNAAAIALFALARPKP